MKLSFVKIILAVSLGISMPSMHAMDAAQGNIQDVSLSLGDKVTQAINSLPVAQICQVAQSAALIALVDVASASVVQTVSDSYGNVVGQLSGAAVSSLVLMKLKILEKYNNGQLALVSLKDILPFNTLLNAPGFSKKPVLFSLLSLAGFAHAYNGDLAISSTYTFAAILALKTILFNDNNQEAVGYNLSSHLFNLVPVQALMSKFMDK